MPSCDGLARLIHFFEWVVNLDFLPLRHWLADYEEPILICTCVSHRHATATALVVRNSNIPVFGLIWLISFSKDS